MSKLGVTMDNLFKKALAFVLKWEGGYANNPNDKGGATNKGITQNTYNNWLKTQGLTSKDIKNISNEEIEQIYYKNYWLAAGCNKMDKVFAILVFDTAVNMGFGRAKEFLQTAEWKYPEKFIKARKDKYQEFAQYGNQRIFLRGWLNRLADLEKYIKIV